MIAILESNPETSPQAFASNSHSEIANFMQISLDET
jgi:hypothetical protein